MGDSATPVFAAAGAGSADAGLPSPLLPAHESRNVKCAFWAEVADALPMFNKLIRKALPCPRLLDHTNTGSEIVPSKDFMWRIDVKGPDTLSDRSHVTEGSSFGGTNQ